MRVEHHQHARDMASRSGRWATWRVRRLIGAGFPASLAGELAADPRVDVHALLDLVDRGCAPRLAARILAPLDDEPLQS
jgi:hypothetical protein